MIAGVDLIHISWKLDPFASNLHYINSNFFYNDSAK